MTGTLQTVNFKEGPYARLHDYSHKDDNFMIVKTETIPWKIFIRLTRTIPPEENQLAIDGRLMDDAGTEKHLAIDIECLYEHKSTDNWYMVAEFEFLLEIGNEKITKKLEHRFENSSKIFNSGSLDIPQGFAMSMLEDSGNLLIKPKIEIKEDIGVILSEFSIPRNIDSEIVVRFDNHLLFVDKYALMCFSPVMRELITGNELRIPSGMFHFEDFITFLRMLYGQKQEFTAKNVEGLSLLASAYEIDFYISECEDYIISTKDLENGYKLNLSWFSSMPKVQAAIMEIITMEDIKKHYDKPFYVVRENEELIAKKLGDNAETIIKELKSTEKWKPYLDFIEMMRLKFSSLEEALEISKHPDVLADLKKLKPTGN